MDGFQIDVSEEGTWISDPAPPLTTYRYNSTNGRIKIGHNYLYLVAKNYMQKYFPLTTSEHFQTHGYIFRIKRYCAA